MKNPSIFVLCLLITLHSSPSIRAEDALHSQTQEGAHAIDDEHAEIHWAYQGEASPENWGKIKADFKTCRLGQFQSPVDLKETIHADLPPIEIDYKDAPLEILNNGHTIQINYPEGSKMTVDGVVYNLLQFHFHTPSEHTIDGKSFPMELHFVHKTAEGKLGVLGVMIEEGAQNDAAQIIWDSIPTGAGDTKKVEGITISAKALLPQEMQYFRLSGSLTTPPCSEGVNWHVLAAPISFSKEQIAKFKSIYPLNARPVQPLGNRLLLLDR